MYREFLSHLHNNPKYKQYYNNQVKLDDHQAYNSCCVLQ